jgi:hypothetical protein
MSAIPRKQVVHAMTDREGNVEGIRPNLPGQVQFRRQDQRQRGHRWRYI